MKDNEKMGLNLTFCFYRLVRKMTFTKKKKKIKEAAEYFTAFGVHT